MTAKRYASVFDAIADTPQEAVNLRLRAVVMQRIAQRIERKGWTQREAAEQCNITQPRMNDLLRGRLSRFSLDALVNIGASVGLHFFKSRPAKPRRRKGHKIAKSKPASQRERKRA